MSKKRIVLLVSAALVVGVLAVGGGAAYVYAKGSAALGEGPPLPFLGGGFFGGRGGHHGMAGFAGEDGNPMEMFNAAAEALGMTPEELFAELQAGKTPQEILDENDVDLATLAEKMGLTLPEGAEGFHGEGWMGRMGGFAGEDGHPMDMFNAAAEVLGMTPEELFAELQAGKTPQEILDAKVDELAALRESLPDE